MVGPGVKGLVYRFRVLGFNEFIMGTLRGVGLCSIMQEVDKPSPHVQAGTE